MRKQSGRLHGIAHATSERGELIIVYRLPKDFDRACIGNQETIDMVKQSRFSTATFSEDRRSFTGRNVQ